MSVLVIKQGDTARSITDTLSLDGVPIVLTGATVILVWKQPDRTINRRSAAVPGPTTGDVSYAPVLADVTQVGRHKLEWEITFASGKVISVPNTGYINLVIEDDLG